eukprot:gene25163-10794_t
MFEAQVAFYLNKYLGRYLDGLDAESLRISVWKGDVSLTNLALKPEALADLELPITVRAGLLGRLTLKVPWNKLGREPVIVEFDGLYILAGPRSNPDVPLSQDMAEYDAQMIAKELESKLKRIQAAELEWIQELGQKGLSPEEQKVDAPKGGGWSVASFVEPILGNLQIRLTNLHIRYEDDTSFLGHNMALGFMFSEIGAHTVDDKGRRAFVTDNVLQCLRKVGARSKGGGPGQARGDRPGIRGLYVGFMFSEIGAHTVDDKGRRAFVTDNVLQCLRKVWARSKGGGPGQA